MYATNISIQNRWEAEYEQHVYDEKYLPAHVNNDFVCIEKTAEDKMSSTS